MPRTTQLHPASLLAGAAFALLAIVAMGQSPVANRPQLDHESPYLQVAHPRDWVQIKDGVQYTVPTGKILVPTAIGCGSCGPASKPELRIDGELRVSSTDLSVGQPETSMRVIPLGIAAPQGSVLTITNDSSGEGEAWGYLVDA